MISRLIDSIVAAVSPVAAIRRQKARKMLRSYAGAEPSRVSSNRHPKNLPADLELTGPFGADKVRAWSRDLVRNNSYAWGVVDTIVSSVVGCGIKAQSTYETPEGEDLEAINDQRDKVWSEWIEVCDVNGQYTLDEMQAAIQREIVEAGEVLVRIVRTPELSYRGIHRPVPLALELIEADRLAGDKDSYITPLYPESENRIVRGVELDDLGRPVAYWVYKDHPLQPHTFTRTPERIPARDILHLFRRDRIGQTRGVSWFSPVLSSIRDLGTYIDNELIASAVASCYTIAIKTETPIGSLIDPDGADNTDSAGNRVRYTEPGMVMELQPGEDVVGLNPGRPNSGAEPWIQLILRSIAVGTGLSYEVVARDYSQTSYSSSRTSQLEDRRRFRCWQQHMIRHFLQPCWDAFCDAASIQGVRGFPTSAELLADRRRFAPVEWQTPEWEWVDPTSEQSAAKDAISSFMSDYQTELGSRGRSWRAVFYQRAKEDRLRQRLGLLSPEEKQQEISAAQTIGMAEQTQSTEPQVVEQPSEAIDVSATALNGAQVTSMVEVINQIGAGAIPKESGKAIIAAAFPTMSQSLIDSIVDPIVVGSIQVDGAPVVRDMEQEQSTGTGEMSGLSTLQFNRNRKAITKTLDDLAAGSISEAAARVFLSSIGMSPDNVEALIADASDGVVDGELDEIERNCGTGAGGFEPGNTCGSGGGGGGGASSKSNSERLRDRIEGTDKEVAKEQKKSVATQKKLEKQLEAAKASKAANESSMSYYESKLEELKTKKAALAAKIAASQARTAELKAQLGRRYSKQKNIVARDDSDETKNNEIDSEVNAYAELLEQLKLINQQFEELQQEAESEFNPKNPKIENKPESSGTVDTPLEEAK